MRDWEPRLALVGDLATEVARAASERLEPGGMLVLEAHADRALLLADQLEAIGYSGATVTRDLAGRDRVVEARWT